jgi:spore germination cell wall hydrolase CwlJ-like protein
VYHEARGEPLKGQRAVLDVARARMLQSGSSACDVVKKPGQFSWYKGQLLLANPEIERMLVNAYEHQKVLKSETYFFSGAAPRWAVGMKCRRIGHHTFCKERK